MTLGIAYLSGNNYFTKNTTNRVLDELIDSFKISNNDILNDKSFIKYNNNLFYSFIFTALQNYKYNIHDESFKKNLNIILKNKFFSYISHKVDNINKIKNISFNEIAYVRYIFPEYDKKYGLKSDFNFNINSQNVINFKPSLNKISYKNINIENGFLFFDLTHLFKIFKGLNIDYKLQQLLYQVIHEKLMEINNNISNIKLKKGENIEDIIKENNIEKYFIKKNWNKVIINKLIEDNYIEREDENIINIEKNLKYVNINLINFLRNALKIYKEDIDLKDIIKNNIMEYIDKSKYSYIIIEFYDQNKKILKSYLYSEENGNGRFDGLKLYNNKDFDIEYREILEDNLLNYIFRNVLDFNKFLRNKDGKIYINKNILYNLYKGTKDYKKINNEIMQSLKYLKQILGEDYNLTIITDYSNKEHNFGFLFSNVDYKRGIIYKNLNEKEIYFIQEHKATIKKYINNYFKTIFLKILKDNKKEINNYLFFDILNSDNTISFIYNKILNNK